MVKYVEMKGIPIGGPTINLLITDIVKDPQCCIPQSFHLEINQRVGQYFGKWWQSRCRLPIQAIDNRSIAGQLCTVNRVGHKLRSILLPKGVGSIGEIVLAELAGRDLMRENVEDRHPQDIRRIFGTTDIVYICGDVLERC